jgi:hypothetical protein
MKQKLHARRHFASAEVPNFDGQCAAMCDAKQMHQDVSIGEKAWPSGAYQDTRPGEMVRGIGLKFAKALFKKSLVVLARRRHHLT